MDTNQFEKYLSIPDEKFVLANEQVRMTDVKLDTKPTSFAKDSFRRFCKNKSSVVAAFILGILILFAIFVPIFIPVKPTEIHPGEEFLAPKLFNAGTGWWDGTVKYNNIPYDVDNETPFGYVKEAVRELQIDDSITYTDKASVGGKGGYVMFENQSRASSTRNGGVNYLKSEQFTVTADGGYNVTIAMGKINGIRNGVLGEYMIAFSSFEEVEEVEPVSQMPQKVEKEVTRVVLRDWTSTYEDGTLDVSAALQAAGLESLDGKLVFWLKPVEDDFSYILIESLEISAKPSVANYADLETTGFADATQMVLLAKDAQGVFPKGYWNCDGRKGVFNSEVRYCSFRYDTYEAAYGLRSSSYAWSDFSPMIGVKFNYDPAIGPESFEKLTDDCPIDVVVEQVNNKLTKKPKTIIVQSYRYRDLGYTGMPKFIFGTNNKGADVFSHMFAGLRTSLILGVCTFAFCFMFGLCWGAISGYFGGWVDLTMERFCDILGGVPWMVVMTLCILHLGNNFATFVIALCATGWMGTAGGTRTQFYRFKNREYVLAARTLGAKDMRLIFKHILPNSLGTIVTSSVLMIPSVIYSEASLAYLNLGLQGTSSFGVMLADNQAYINSHAYLIIVPSVVMALLMISFNLFGNGLRDAINPTLKGA